MAEGRVVSYTPPLKDNPLFRDAMRRCIEAQDNFKPLAGSLTKEKIKQLERKIKEGK